MVAAGKYLAKIKSYGIGSTKDGKEKLDVLFVFKDEMGSEQTLWWSGYFSEKALPITAKALLTMGLKDGAKYNNLGEGPDSGLLEMDRDVEIDVKHEEFNGKTTAKIAWVNRPGGNQFMEKGMAATKLRGLNLGPALAAAKAEMGAPKEKKTKTEEELGF